MQLLSGGNLKSHATASVWWCDGGGGDGGGGAVRGERLSCSTGGM